MQKNSLVIFKSKPAKVLAILDKKIEIETVDGKNIKLPPKNVELLVESDKDFDVQELVELSIDDLEMTWELLQEQETTNIEELCEFLFENVAVNEAYTIWLLVQKGEYFSFGDGFVINIHSQEQKDNIIAERLEKQRKEKEITDFVERVQEKIYLADDERFIKEIVNLAIGKSTTCRFFKYLSMEESENNAYKLLLEIGYWNEFNNPYLYRYGAELNSNPADIEFHDTVERKDLTHLQSYAIDDEGSNDPDDAISWDEQSAKMWVHVADPSAAISFGDEADSEARARGTNLYVPENIVSMLPQKATDIFGLGLTEVSPALSIGFTVAESGDIENVEICFSSIKVTRLSYEYAEDKLDTLGLGEIATFAQRFTQKRLQNGAVELDFPEVKIKLEDKVVKISDLPRLNSRTMVRDTMLMAGVAVGQYCLANVIPVPYSTQPEHELTEEDLANLNTPADMVAARKKLQRGCHSVVADRHSGMGLTDYVQVTSPLRRYLDLVVHYQLRRHLTSQELLSVDTIKELIAQVEVPIKANRQTERFSNAHWKLVYLTQNPDWCGDATVVEKLHQKGRVFVSVDDLALMKKLSIGDSVQENDVLKLQSSNVNFVSQEAFFKVL